MRARLAAAAVVGFVAGAIVIGWVGSTGGDGDGGSNGGDGSSAPTGDPSSTTTTTTSTTTSATTTTLTTVAAPPADTLLTWTSGGLPPGFAAAVAGLAEVDHVSVVAGDVVGLVSTTGADGTEVERVDAGWTILLDVLALDPDAHAPFEPAVAEVLALLEPGGALLTSTSAELRGVGEGATLVLETGEVTVAGTVPDVPGVGAEVIVHADDADRLGVAAERYLLIEHHGDRAEVQAAIDGLLGGLDADQTTRFRTRAETTWLRHGDAVLPAALVKARFGEFATRDLAGRAVEIEPAWIDEHIVDAEVPIVGTVRCHRDLIEPLRTALGGLEDAGLAHLVDPGDYSGCFAARRIAAGLPLSRHAWGIAVDLNVGDNPRGSFATQDPALVEAMRAVGFGWGGTWLIPDPAHYEAVDLR